MGLQRRLFLSGSLCASLAALASCRPRVEVLSEVPGSDSAVPAGGDAKPTKTLLVLGGTGFLGPHVVEAALARGYTVTLFNRGKTNPHLFPKLEKLRGDRDGGLDELAAAIAGGRRFDVVLDTSGYVPRIVRASAELLAPAVDHYIFISSISVYATPKVHGLDETAAVAVLEDAAVEEITGETYGPLKALCEAAAEEVMPGRVTTVRPGLIVGPGDPTDRYTYWPARVARGGPMVAPGSPQDPVQYIDVRDLADWLTVCMERRHLGIYNAVGRASQTTIGALIDACLEAAGGDAQPVWIDAAFLEEHEVMPWVHMPVWVPPSGEDGGLTQVSIAKALALGLSFRPARETAADTLAYWRALPEERRAEPKAGLDSAKEAEVLAAWRARPNSGAKRAELWGLHRPSACRAARCSVVGA